MARTGELHFGASRAYAPRYFTQYHVERIIFNYVKRARRAARRRPCRPTWCGGVHTVFASIRRARRKKAFAGDNFLLHSEVASQRLSAFVLASGTQRSHAARSKLPARGCARRAPCASWLAQLHSCSSAMLRSGRATQTRVLLFARRNTLTSRPA